MEGEQLLGGFCSTTSLQSRELENQRHSTQVTERFSYDSIALQEKSLGRDLGGAAESLPPASRGNNHCKPRGEVFLRCLESVVDWFSQSTHLRF